jgi:hypothetical protein
MNAVNEFETLAAPFRQELLAHCYWMLGSIHGAENLVQDTHLRARRLNTESGSPVDILSGPSHLQLGSKRAPAGPTLTAFGRAGPVVPTPARQWPTGPRRRRRCLEGVRERALSTTAWRQRALAPRRPHETHP